MSRIRLSACLGYACAVISLVGPTGCSPSTPCASDVDCSEPNGLFCYQGSCQPKLQNDRWDCQVRCTAGTSFSKSVTTDICVKPPPPMSPSGGQTEANTICTKKAGEAGFADLHCGCAVTRNDGSCAIPFLAAAAIGATGRDPHRCQILTDDATRSGFVATLLPVPPSTRAKVTFNGSTTNVTPSGEVAFAINQGTIRFNWMRTSMQNFVLAGHNVTGAFLNNDGLPATALLPAGSAFPPTARAFVFPAFSFNAVAKAEVDGVFISRTVPLSQSMTGVVDLPSRLFRIAGVFNSPDGKIGIDMDVSYRIDNLPPVADASATATTVECTGNLHGAVHLDGTRSSDPDGAGDIRSYTWLRTVGTTPTVIATGAIADVSLPLGTHQLELVVGDSVDQRVAAALTVTVGNTTPPALSAVATLSCLWPGDHRMVLFRLGSEIQATAQSACDPSTVVFISKVESNQLDTRGGQGNTSPDVVHGTAAACLRAERQGTRRHSRIYSIEVTAADGQGNRTTKTVFVDVPHDRGHGNSCRQVDESLIVEDGDARCTANVSGVIPALAQPPATAPALAPTAPASAEPPGCAAAPGALTLIALAMALLRFRRRPAAG